MRWRSATSARASIRSRTSSRPLLSGSPPTAAAIWSTAPIPVPATRSSHAARDADLLFIEATLPRPERTGLRGHLTPEEAGHHAREAGAKRVVITHISDELGDDWALEEAEKGFGAPVEIAREGAVYEV